MCLSFASFMGFDIRNDGKQMIYSKMQNFYHDYILNIKRKSKIYLQCILNLRRKGKKQIIKWMSFELGIKICPNREEKVFFSIILRVS